jgi:hypothetical protein
MHVIRYAEFLACIVGKMHPAQVGQELKTELIVEVQIFQNRNYLLAGSGEGHQPIRLIYFRDCLSELAYKVIYYDLGGKNCH